MKFGPPEVDYLKFRFSKLNTPRYRHLQLLVFWSLFGICFLILERIWIRDSYYPMYCPLDDLIPFCEYFLIPYLFWFIYLIGYHIYALLYDVAAFRRLMKFLIFSHAIAVVLFVVFPNCQELRPVVFERDNAFTRFMAGFYLFDTNTNVCPSLHVIASVAVLVSAWDSKHFCTPGWRAAFTAAAVLISLSTVFLKQHSVLDVLISLPICGLSYWFATGTEPKKEGRSPSALPRSAQRPRREGAGG